MDQQLPQNLRATYPHHAWALGFHDRAAWCVRCGPRLVSLKARLSDLARQPCPSSTLDLLVFGVHRAHDFHILGSCAVWSIRCGLHLKMPSRNAEWTRAALICLFKFRFVGFTKLSFKNVVKLNRKPFQIKMPGLDGLGLGTHNRCRFRASMEHVRSFYTFLDLLAPLDPSRCAGKCTPCRYFRFREACGGASRPAAGTDWLGRSFGFPKTPEGSATREAVI